MTAPCVLTTSVTTSKAPGHGPLFFTIPLSRVPGILVTIGLLLTLPAPLRAENWLPFTSISLELPGGDAVVKGYSESYYDSDSIRRSGDSRVQVWLKDVTYLGDLEPHIHKELLRIDCSRNSFESFTGGGDPAGVADLQEINRGTIGEDSPYRIIRKTVCGY